jgi:hypothetical protein
MNSSQKITFCIPPGEYLKREMDVPQKYRVRKNREAPHLFYPGHTGNPSGIVSWPCFFFLPANRIVIFIFQTMSQIL